MDLIQPENKTDLMIVDIVPVLLDQPLEPIPVNHLILVGKLLEQRLQVPPFLIVYQEGMFQLVEFMKIDLLVLEVVAYLLDFGV